MQLFVVHGPHGSMFIEADAAKIQAEGALVFSEKSGLLAPRRTILCFAAGSWLAFQRAGSYGWDEFGKSKSVNAADVARVVRHGGCE